MVRSDAQRKRRQLRYDAFDGLLNIRGARFTIRIFEFVEALPSEPDTTFNSPDRNNLLACLGKSGYSLAFRLGLRRTSYLFVNKQVCAVATCDI